MRLDAIILFNVNGWPKASAFETLQWWCSRVIAATKEGVTGRATLLAVSYGLV